MLLMGMPGLPEWIILITLLIIVVVVVRVVRKKSRLSQKQSQAQHTNVHINNTSISSELEKLSSLKDKGVITQEEFDEQKRRLLNS